MGMRGFMIFGLLLLLAPGGCKEKPGTMTVYISNKNGANLYAKPSLNSKVLKRLPINETLTVLQNESKKIILENEVGRWHKAQYSTFNGYIFSSNFSESLTEVDFSEATTKVLEKGFWYARRFNQFSQRLLFKNNRLKLLSEKNGARFDLTGTVEVSQRDVKITWPEGQLSECVLLVGSEEIVESKNILKCNHQFTDTRVSAFFYDKSSRIEKNTERTIAGFPVATLGPRIGKAKEDVELYMNPDIYSTRITCSAEGAEFEKTSLPRFSEFTIWARSIIASELNGVNDFWYYVQINAIPGDAASRCEPSDRGWVFGSKFKYTRL